MPTAYCLLHAELRFYEFLALVEDVVEAALGAAFP
jgi:hypothetical protein